MKAKFGLYVVPPLLLLVLSFTSVLPALAYADVGSFSGSCSRFKATGTTNQDYVVVEVYSYAVNNDVVRTAFPVSGGHFNISVSYDSQPKGTEMYYAVWGSPTNNTSGYDYEVYFDVDHQKCGLQSSSSDGAGEPAGNLFDGRLNNTDQSRDVAAPVAIYKESDGTLAIYAIDPSTGSGTKALTLTPAQLSGAGIPSGSNLTLGETTVNGFHIILSRLTTGELQLNVTGPGIQPYIVAWPADNPSALYHVSP